MLEWFMKDIQKDRYTKEKGYRYSSLFYLMKDIRYCFGARKQFNSIRGRQFDPANFAGVILVHVVFKNFVKRFFNGDFPNFAKKYMDIKNNEDVKDLKWN